MNDTLYRYYHCPSIIKSCQNNNLKKYFLKINRDDSNEYFKKFRCYYGDILYVFLLCDPNPELWKVIILERLLFAAENGFTGAYSRHAILEPGHKRSRSLKKKEKEEMQIQKSNVEKNINDKKNNGASKK